MFSLCLFQVAAMRKIFHCLGIKADLTVLSAESRTELPNTETTTTASLEASEDETEDDARMHDEPPVLALSCHTCTHCDQQLGSQLRLAAHLADFHQGKTLKKCTGRYLLSD